MEVKKPLLSLSALLICCALIAGGISASAADNGDSQGDVAVLISSSEDNYTDEYLQYLEDVKNNNLDGYGGVLPDPVKPNIDDEDYSCSTRLASYDPRQKNLLTPVKNQGSLNTCWAFASNAVLESSLSYQTGIKKSFSEEHMRWLLSLRLCGKNGGSPNYEGYYIRQPEDGSFYSSAAAYYTNWNEPYFMETSATSVKWHAPVSSSDIPYTQITDKDYWPDNIETAENDIVVTDTSYISNAMLKDYILEYGGACAPLKWKNIFFNDNNATYYNPTNIKEEKAFHAVTIVGWDDYYPKENFNETPRYDGAWLVKNSWGTSSGDGGYFWLSYYDKYFTENNVNAVITGIEPADDNERMLSYDFMKMTGYKKFEVNNRTPVYMANVFDLSDLCDEYGQINRVMFYSGSVGSGYKLYIEPVNADGSLPDTASLTNPVASGVVESEGYHTINLPSPYTIGTNAGKYAIIVKFTGNTDQKAFLNYEKGDREARSDILRGESYCNIGNGWHDTYADYPWHLGGNFCIRPVLYKRNATVVNSSISPVSGTYRGSTLYTNMTLNGNSLFKVETNSGRVLHQDTDYTISGNRVTFSNSFLSSLDESKSNKVVFTFSSGGTKTYTVNFVKATLNNVEVSGVNAVDKTLKAECDFSREYDNYDVSYQW